MDEAEVEAIEAFIREVKEKDPDGGKHLLSRPPPEYRHAAENRLLYVCVVQDKIAALSGVFFVPFKAEEQVRPDYLEFGSTAVHPDWRSFGLQKLLGRVRIAMAAISEPELVLGTAIDPTNLGSRKSMISVGFEAWPTGDVPACAFEPCTGCEKRAGLAEGVKCCSEFLRLSDQQKRAQVGVFLDQVVPRLEGRTGDLFAPPRVTLPHRTEPGSSLIVTLACGHLRHVSLVHDLAAVAGRELAF